MHDYRKNMKGRTALALRPVQEWGCLLYMVEREATRETQGIFSPARRVNKGEVMARNEVCAKVKDLYGKTETRCRSLAAS
jgi:hypothetical protein